mmetsp:Transcript_87135/g.244450  ORF Transcript_87135/g.244450 Transcript_87135/m.244450 type:complete len:200 (+) Transcript_87135:540-1139(+)
MHNAPPAPARLTFKPSTSTFSTPPDISDPTAIAAARVPCTVKFRMTTFRVGVLKPRSSPKQSQPLLRAMASSPPVNSTFSIKMSWELSGFTPSVLGSRTGLAITTSRTTMPVQAKGCTVHMGEFVRRTREMRKPTVCRNSTRCGSVIPSHVALLCFATHHRLPAPSIQPQSPVITTSRKCSPDKNAMRRPRFEPSRPKP